MRGRLRLGCAAFSMLLGPLWGGRAVAARRPILIGQPPAPAVTRPSPAPLTGRDAAPPTLHVVVDAPDRLVGSSGTFIHVAVYGPTFGPVQGAVVDLGALAVGRTDSNGTLVFYNDFSAGADAGPAPQSRTVHTAVRVRRSAAAASFSAQVPLTLWLVPAPVGRTRLAVQTDRDAYRPGTPLQLRLTAWHLAGTYRPVGNASVDLVLRDADGRFAGSGRVVTSALGVGTFQLPLPAAMPPGSYTLAARLQDALERVPIVVLPTAPPESVQPAAAQTRRGDASFTRTGDGVVPSAAWSALRAEVQPRAPVAHRPLTVMVSLAAGYTPGEPVVHADLVDRSGAIVDTALLPWHAHGGEMVASGRMRAPSWGPAFVIVFCLARPSDVSSAATGLAVGRLPLSVRSRRILSVRLRVQPQHPAAGQRVHLRGWAGSGGDHDAATSVGVLVRDAPQGAPLEPPAGTDPVALFYGSGAWSTASRSASVVSRDWGALRTDRTAAPAGFYAAAVAGERPTGGAVVGDGALREQPATGPDAVAKIAGSGAKGPAASAPDDSEARGSIARPVRGRVVSGPAASAVVAKPAASGTAPKPVASGMAVKLAASDTVAKPAGAGVAPGVDSAAVGVASSVPRIWLGDVDAPHGRFGFDLRLPADGMPQLVQVTASDGNGGVGWLQQVLIPQPPASGQRASGDAGASASPPAQGGSVPQHAVSAAAPPVSPLKVIEAQWQSGQDTTAVPLHVTSGERAMVRISIPGNAAVAQLYASLRVGDAAVTRSPGSQAVTAFHLATALQAQGRLSYERALHLRAVIAEDVASVATHLDRHGFVLAGKGGPSACRTARALAGLLAAQQTNFPVPTAVITRITSALLDAVGPDGELHGRDPGWWSGEGPEVQLGLNAAVFRVLAQAGPKAITPSHRKALAAMRRAMTMVITLTGDPLTLANAGLGVVAYETQDRKRLVSDSLARDLVRRLLEARSDGGWQPLWFHAVAGNLIASARAFALLRLLDPTKAAALAPQLLTSMLRQRQQLGVSRQGWGIAALAGTLAALPGAAASGGLRLRLRVNGHLVDTAHFSAGDPFAATAWDAVDISAHLHPGSNQVQLFAHGAARPVMAVQLWRP